MNMTLHVCDLAVFEGADFTVPSFSQTQPALIDQLLVHAAMLWCHQRTINHSSHQMVMTADYVSVLIDAQIVAVRTTLDHGSIMTATTGRSIPMCVWHIAQAASCHALHTTHLWPFYTTY